MSENQAQAPEQGRPRDTDRKTRVHLSTFDRFKFLHLAPITNKLQ